MRPVGQTPATDTFELMRCLVDDGLLALDTDPAGRPMARVGDREALWQLRIILEQRIVPQGETVAETLRQIAAGDDRHLVVVPAVIGKEQVKPTSGGGVGCCGGLTRPGTHGDHA